MTERINLINRLRRRLGWSYTTFDPSHVMPAKFERLAQYNSEHRRGIAHTPEMDAEMAVLQDKFNDWIRLE